MGRTDVICGPKYIYCVLYILNNLSTNKPISLIFALQNREKISRKNILNLLTLPDYLVKRKSSDICTL